MSESNRHLSNAFGSVAQHVRRQRCKHIYAVEIVLQRDVTVSNDGQTQTVTETTTVTVRKKYTQDWANYNKAQTTKKSHFVAFLYELCSKIEEPSQKRGRGRPRLPLADVIFTVTFKTYSTMSARRFASDMVWPIRRCDKTEGCAVHIGIG